MSKLVSVSERHGVKLSIEEEIPLNGTENLSQND